MHSTTKSQLAAMNYLADVKPTRYKIVEKSYLQGIDYILRERKKHIFEPVFVWFDIHKVRLQWQQ